MYSGNPNFATCLEINYNLSYKRALSSRRLFRAQIKSFYQKVQIVCGDTSEMLMGSILNGDISGIHIGKAV